MRSAFIPAGQAPRMIQTRFTFSVTMKAAHPLASASAAQTTTMAGTHKATLKRSTSGRSHPAETNMPSWSQPMNMTRGENSSPSRTPMATQSPPPAMPPSRIRCATGGTITISTQASTTCKAGIMTRRSGDLST